MVNEKAQVSDFSSDKQELLPASTGFFRRTDCPETGG
jgi:hypothetical protein